jgi:hypothetical protein
MPELPDITWGFSTDLYKKSKAASIATEMRMFCGFSILSILQGKEWHDTL